MFAQDLRTILLWWVFLFILGVVNFPATWLLLRRFFDAASLAGRKIFFGWPYFSWSAGHDTNTRAKIIEKMLSPPDLFTLCSLLNRYNIDYISIVGSGYNEAFEINFDLFEKNFDKLFENEVKETVIYEAKSGCNRH